jgi:hypothetical protein
MIFLLLYLDYHLVGIIVYSDYGPRRINEVFGGSIRTEIVMPQPVLRVLFVPLNLHWDDGEQEGSNARQFVYTVHWIC